MAAVQSLEKSLCTTLGKPLNLFVPSLTQLFERRGRRDSNSDLLYMVVVKNYF